MSTMVWPKEILKLRKFSIHFQLSALSKERLVNFRSFCSLVPPVNWLSNFFKKLKIKILTIPFSAHHYYDTPIYHLSSPHSAPCFTPFSQAKAHIANQTHPLHNTQTNDPESVLLHRELIPHHREDCPASSHLKDEIEFSQICCELSEVRLLVLFF